MLSHRLLLVSCSHNQSFDICENCKSRMKGLEVDSSVTSGAPNKFANIRYDRGLVIIMASTGFLRRSSECTCYLLANNEFSVGLSYTKE